MIKKDQISIAIPLYKAFNELTKEEKISLKSTSEKLNQFQHIIFGPRRLDWDKYQAFYHSLGTSVKIIFFASQYFSDINGYNQLLKSLKFYIAFSKYKFILIFQPDAYVFKDELEYWCNKGYDYIGAPWFDGFDLATSNEFIGVGNGGFSLRNIKCSRRILKRIYLLKKLRHFWFKSHLQAIWRFHRMLTSFNFYFKIRSIADLNALLFLKDPVQEDHFWAQLIGKVFVDYKVAPVEDGIKFSFEVNPEFLYIRNNNKLPFGCHAWQKYNREFWKPFILNLKAE